MARKKTRTEGEQQAEGKATSKVEAVRAALDMGKDQPEDGIAFIKDRFGIEMSRQHFSTTKSKLKKGEGSQSVKRTRKAPSRGPAVQATDGEQDVIAALEA